MERPDTHYARSGNVYVAYQAFGQGPFDLVVVPGAFSNIEYGWEVESWQNYYGALASFARVLLFDKRGTGISDPVPLGTIGRGANGRCAGGDGRSWLRTSCTHGLVGRRGDGGVVRSHLPRTHGRPRSR